MRLVGRQLIDEFMKHHADVRGPLRAWITEVEAAEWAGPQDIKNRYASASFLADNHVVFNIKGPAYRVKVQVAYATGVVIVTNVGTHAEYSRW